MPSMQEHASPGRLFVVMLLLCFLPHRGTGTLPLGNDAPQIAPAETTMPTEEPKQDMASAEGVDQEHAEPHMLLIDPAIEPKKGKKTKKKSQRQQEKQERGEQTVQPDQIMDALEVSMLSNLQQSYVATSCNKLHMFFFLNM